MALQLPAFMITPDYAGGSIVNLTSSLARHFGVITSAPVLRQPLALEGVETIVLFIADGLGQWQLEKHIADGDMPNVKALLEDSTNRSLTSVFPSTTMAAITGMHMAATPAQTGWLGYTLWLEEVNAVTEMIGQVDLVKQTKLEEPDFLKTFQSIYAKLERQGISAFSVAPSEYRFTWLNEWYWARAMQYGYLSANTCASIAMPALQSTDQKMVVVYWADYDTVCHKHGPSSQEASDEINALDNAVARLLKRIPKNGKTAFVLTADHGQTDLLEKKTVYLEQQRDLMPLLLSAPAGDRVCRTFRVKPGMLEEVRDMLEVTSHTVLATEAWEAGLFGGLPAQDTFYQRVGDLIAMPRDGAQLCYTFPGRHPSRPHKGSHGALSKEEMLVPLIFTRF
ncbi:MAG: hypothetical protein RLZZ156_943 [Deinococcota bacterium]